MYVPHINDPITGELVEGTTEEVNRICSYLCIIHIKSYLFVQIFTRTEAILIGHGDASCSRRLQLNYVKMQVLGCAYNDTYNFFFSIMFFHLVIGVIAATYCILNAECLPSFMIAILVVADVSVISSGHFMFSSATSSYQLSRQVLNAATTRGNFRLNEDRKFWREMKPIRVDIGNFFSFETREFLLVIWGNVVVSKIIDLLRRN